MRLFCFLELHCGGDGKIGGPLPSPDRGQVGTETLAPLSAVWAELSFKSRETRGLLNREPLDLITAQMGDG